MRLNLSIKFFMAFLATSVTIVAVMIGAMQFYADRSFSDYVHKVEAIRLSELVPVLNREFQRSQGWERLRDNPKTWHELLQPHDSAVFAEKPPSLPAGFKPYPKPPPMPRDIGGEGRPERPGRFPEAGAIWDGTDRRSPPDEPGGGGPGEDRGRGRDEPVLGLEHRLTLFDAQKKPVIGRAGSPEGHTLQELVIYGKTAGWLGLRNQERPSDPLDMAFLKQQSRAFYFVGALALVLAAVMAFLLSRHLLSPVQQLIQGTRSLTNRKFDTRINVNSSDELGQLAGDFNQMARTLEQYEQLRQQWISDIAHELRTPLSILRGEIEAIQDGIREASSQRLESLHAEVVHMSRIVGNLHDLSLAESAALHIKKEPVDPARVLRTCLDKFQNMFAERRIEIVDALGDMEPILILGDKDRLTQVFSNLLENTLRYTDSPGSLTVRRRRAANAVVLQLADTLPAVPTESLDRLFDRLYRVDPSRSRALGGSGLGLSICKTIIEAHEGTITALHAAAGGLQIEVRLPLRDHADKHSQKVTDNHDR